MLNPLSWLDLSKEATSLAQLLAALTFLVWTFTVPRRADGPHPRDQRITSVAYVGVLVALIASIDARHWFWAPLTGIWLLTLVLRSVVDRLDRLAREARTESAPEVPPAP